ncbi:hypothetical protein TRIATDRAFT_256636 [Trichoderma atroviride IMI 206040]|uniref:Uncharacterized protein n=1 Tax=Hypocrea atroviridis (strain ATCC 20476 / IMI 206040) TaxID=452589 RepID=G9NU57_HYPAI|nr:uncharacterized protein TRIATDRAFT_256636 [Trichoderma atroviride IMI 206040]EHK45590.1 hypothetical protein TRIATDRAFT_256636 [Trichoderma atroviride IMI 206040]
MYLWPYSELMMTSHEQPHKGTATRGSSCPVPYYDDRHGSRATLVRSPLGSET